MKLIGVLSDTHMEQPDAKLFERINQCFQDVDLVLHAGDITNLVVLEALAPLETLAVCGNMDDHLVSANLPVKRILELEGHKIGLIHGWGAPNGLETRISREFQGVDCIVFGHSHQPTNYKKGGVLYFNPGSPRQGYRGSGTVGLLSVDKEITGRIIEL